MYGFTRDVCTFSGDGDTGAVGAFSRFVGSLHIIISRKTQRVQKKVVNFLFLYCFPSHFNLLGKGLEISRLLLLIFMCPTHTSLQDQNQVSMHCLINTKLYLKLN